MRKFAHRVHRPCLRLALLLLALAVIWGCQPKTESGPPGLPLKLSLGLAPFPYSGLVAIAAEKGFFKESGLDLAIKDYAFGFATLEALSRGEIQMAMGNEFSFAQMIDYDPSLRLVASVALVNTNEIVAQKDRNIHKPADLKGKRIGFCPNTSSEYYLRTFLLVNKITSSEVTMVNLPASGMAEAIVNGDVDAISAWDTIVYDSKKRLPGNAISWPAQNNRDWQWILVAKDITTQTPEPLKRFLRALLKAEDFVLTNNEEAKNIIARRWGFEPDFIQQVWDKTRLRVTLNQSLITSLESFSKWSREKENQRGEGPNFLKYVYTGALDQVNPKAVTIFK
jgi:ABC-type nitrate/sulfonate/bicarbonate transport system substrate-binding protein